MVEEDTDTQKIEAFPLPCCPSTRILSCYISLESKRTAEQCCRWIPYLTYLTNAKVIGARRGLICALPLWTKRIFRKNPSFTLFPSSFFPFLSPTASITAAHTLIFHNLVSTFIHMICLGSCLQNKCMLLLPDNNTASRPQSEGRPPLHYLISTVFEETLPL